MSVRDVSPTRQLHSPLHHIPPKKGGGVSGGGTVGSLSSTMRSSSQQQQQDDSKHRVDSFMCGLMVNGLLRQGSLDIFPTNIQFSAPLLETVQCSYSDIDKIEKKKSMLFIDNAIEIVKSNGEILFFTTFFSRDQAYDVLQQRWKSSPKVTRPLSPSGS
eukprot:PhF_6_TR24167/c0_g1_i1/m.33689